MSEPDADLAILYRRYNAACNAHDFDRLGEFVDEHVQVNGEVQGLAAYADGLFAVARAFPDYQWDLRHLLIDGAGSLRTFSTRAPIRAGFPHFSHPF